MNVRIPMQQRKLAAACAVAALFMSSYAQAQIITPASERDVVTDTRTQVWKNGFGECWHSGFGPPPAPSAACDPKYKPRAQAPAPAPAPVAVVPPVAPAVVAIAAPTPVPVYEKVSLDADTLFDFDKAELRPEGRNALDEFIGKLQGLTVESISATGHADRFGSNEYNQALSSRRADAVRSYLMASGTGLPAVSAVGMGESQPVTKANDCSGPKSTRVIACLQPDRRVEVEVRGTRLKPQ